MADVIAGYPDLVSIVLIILAATLSLRLIQRIYYVLRGHVHHYSYHPRQEMLLFLKKNEIDMTEHSFVSKRDKVCLRYRKLGTGQKIVLLNNGVGTDFYMWLPTIRGKHCSSSRIYSIMKCDAFQCSCQYFRATKHIWICSRYVIDFSPLQIDHAWNSETLIICQVTYYTLCNTPQLQYNIYSTMNIFLYISAAVAAKQRCRAEQYMEAPRLLLIHFNL